MPHRAPGSTGKTRQDYLSGKPIRYYRPRGSAEIRNLIDEGFQAFNAARLGEACRIFSDKMLLPEHDTTIALTVAGALTPAGLGGCIVELMERGLIDFLISTGANLYHDLHYALNFTLHRGSPFVNDVELYDEGVIRIYDVLFPADVLLQTDAYIREFLVRWGVDGPVSTAEFHYALGRDLMARQPGCEAHSVVAAAAAAGVPIYTSSPGDSSIGMNIAYHELMNDSHLMIDPNKDVNEVCAFILAGTKKRLRHSRRWFTEEFLPPGAADPVGGLRNSKGGQRLLHPVDHGPSRLGWIVRRNTRGGCQLGKSEPRRSPGYGRRVLRFDDCVSAVLRVRGRIEVRPASAQGIGSHARCARRETPRGSQERDAHPSEA